MNKSLVARVVVVASVLAGSCAEEPVPPAYPQPPAPQEMEAARMRWAEEQRRQQEERRRAAELAAQAAAQRAAAEEARKREAAERRAADEAAKREERAKKEQLNARREAVLAKMLDWAQAHLSLSASFSGSGRTTCTNAVDVAVPCDSAGARQKQTNFTVTASATVKNDSAVRVTCQAVFGPGIRERSAPKTITKSSAHFTSTYTFLHSVDVIEVEGDCHIPLDAAATILGERIDDLESIFPQPSPSDAPHVMLFSVRVDNKNATKTTATPGKAFFAYMLSFANGSEMAMIAVQREYHKSW